MKIDLSMEEIKMIIDSIGTAIDEYDGTGLRDIETLQQIHNKLIHSCDNGKYYDFANKITDETINIIRYKLNDIVHIDTDEIILKRAEAVKKLNEMFGQTIKLYDNTEKLTQYEYKYLNWLLNSRTVSTLADEVILDIINSKIKNFVEEEKQ